VSRWHARLPAGDAGQQRARRSGDGRGAGASAPVIIRVGKRCRFR
jgi:hypothetical protein